MRASAAGIRVCEGCRIKFAASRPRCPKCLAPVQTTPAPVPQASRAVVWGTASFAGMSLLTLATLYTTRTPIAAARPVVSNAPASAAVRGTATVPGVSPTSPTSTAPRTSRPSALEEYEAAVQRWPNDPGALASLAQALVRAGRAAEAVPYLERAARNDPRASRYVDLARVLADSQRHDDAITAYREAQRLAPEDPAITFSLGSALQARRDDAGAVPEFERAIAMDGSDPAFRLALGRSLEQLGRAQDAVSAYAEYLRLAPASADAEEVRTRIAGIGRSMPSAAQGPGE